MGLVIIRLCRIQRIVQIPEILQRVRALQIVQAQTKLVATLQIKPKRAHRPIQLTIKHRRIQAATRLPTKHKLMQPAATLQTKLSPTLPTSLLATPLIQATRQTSLTRYQQQLQTRQQHQPFFAATETQITIQWGIFSNGGAPITGYIILMAATPSSTDARLLQGTIWVDVTSTGVLDMVNNRFTTANNLVKGFTY